MLWAGVIKEGAPSSAPQDRGTSLHILGFESHFGRERHSAEGIRPASRFFKTGNSSKPQRPPILLARARLGNLRLIFSLLR